MAVILYGGGGMSWLDPLEQTTVEFLAELNLFHEWKKYRLWNGGHFVSASVYEMTGQSNVANMNICVSTITVTSHERHDVSNHRRLDF